MYKAARRRGLVKTIAFQAISMRGGLDTVCFDLLPCGQLFEVEFMSCVILEDNLQGHHICTRRRKCQHFDLKDSCSNDNLQLRAPCLRQVMYSFAWQEKLWAIQQPLYPRSKTCRQRMKLYKITTEQVYCCLHSLIMLNHGQNGIKFEQVNILL